ncbi:MAG: hypothetical protein ABEN55_01365 [Bradymonadaceae bacterium]
MSTPYFQLLGHVALAVHTCETNADIKSALEAEGFGDAQWQTARRLLEEGEQLPDRRDEEVGDERIAEHGVHSSATEVEMWLQTAGFQVKQAVDEEAVLATTLGNDVHSDDHVVEVVARALRMMGMIRTYPTLHEQFGTDRKVKDLLIRGNTLLAKLFDSGDTWLSPGHAGDPDHEVFEALESSRRAMTEWLQGLDEVATLLDDRPAILGELGYVPDDVGLPVGGTGYSITLHERSHREPPDPNEEPKGDPSWTIGRQSRNNENMGGKGWVEPSFD